MEETKDRHFPGFLMGECILAGAAGGFVVMLYRLALAYGAAWLDEITVMGQQTPAYVSLWFLCLLALAWMVGKLMDWEPMSSGGGIPQLEAELSGKLEENWWKVLTAKFAGSFLSLFAGLSLGRGGPAMQLGGMTGKGLARLRRKGKEEERLLFSCGISAGLAAAFHAPLAGTLFSLEEVHKKFSPFLCLATLSAAVTADYVSASFLGFEPILSLEVAVTLPETYYGVLLLLGILTGLAGAFYNWFVLKVQYLYQKLPDNLYKRRLLLPFLAAGALAFSMPQVLGGGQKMMDEMTAGDMSLAAALILLAVKVIFTAVCVGSGVPGGLFFPIFVMGDVLGGVFGLAGVQFLGISEEYVTYFAAAAMSGFLTATMRVPLTGATLVMEITGYTEGLLTLAIVSVVAHVTAGAVGSRPICESLLERILGLTGQKYET